MNRLDSAGNNTLTPYSSIPTQQRIDVEMSACHKQSKQFQEIICKKIPHNILTESR